MPADGSPLNDADYLCQRCSNPGSKLKKPTTGMTNADEGERIDFFIFQKGLFFTILNVDETTDSDISNTVNGKAPESTLLNTEISRASTLNTSALSSLEQLTFQSTNSLSDNPANESQPMEVDEASTRKSSTPNSSTNVPLETSDEREATTPVSSSTKATGRQTKARQNSNNNSTKRSTTKAKTTTTTRQKQTTANERKGRPPATRSKSSGTTAPTTVQTRSSNRRNTKASRYRKRSYSSGSDDDETEEEEDDDDDDTDFAEEVCLRNYSKRL